MVDRKHLPDDVRDENPGAGEQAGEAIGGVGGAAAGAAIGSAAGPVGAIVGGIAGAVGGWWAGEKAGRAAEDMGDHDEHYRSHWANNRREGLEYDDARVGYGVGHTAAHNPDYRGRAFTDVETDLRTGWQGSAHDRSYDDLRPYVREGYEHNRRHVNRD